MVVCPEEAVRCQSSQAQAVALPDAAVVHCPSARAHHLLVRVALCLSKLVVAVAITAATMTMSMVEQCV